MISTVNCNCTYMCYPMHDARYATDTKLVSSFKSQMYISFMIKVAVSVGLILFLSCLCYPVTNAANNNRQTERGKCLNGFD